MHVGRKRLAKMHQMLLVKIAKFGGGKWENEFGGGLDRVAISEGGGGRWVVVVVGEEVGWKFPRLSLAHKSICAGGNRYRRRIMVYSPGVKITPRRGGTRPPYPRRMGYVFAGGKYNIPGA
jgi:hypothetical protein